MRRIFTLLTGIVFTLGVLNAQIIPPAPPQAFSYRAVIKKPNGAPVSLATVSLRVSIYQNNSIAEESYIFRETHTAITDVLGQVSIEIGNGTSLRGIFSSIVWSADLFFLKIEVDVKGGTNYQELSTTQLLSVPYALYAGQAGTAASETDPVFSLHPANGIRVSDIINWEMAYNWGDHNAAGYLKNFNESDPIFSLSPTSRITSDQIAYWDAAYLWGNHSLAGYATIKGLQTLTNKTLTSPIINSPIGLLKEDVGLGEVDNTPDLLKPISAATQAALELKESILTFQNPLSRTANIISLPVASNLSDGYMSIADKTKLDGLHNADGSETIVTSGDNVMITGFGTNTNPYIVNAPGVITGSLNLSRVLSGGNDAGSSKISNLGDPEADHDAATKAYVDELRKLVEALTQRISVLEGGTNNSIIFNPDLTYSTVTDIEGHIYKSIQIGTQTWMAENLRTTKFNDETDIPLLTGPTGSPGYFWYNNDQSTYGDIYGALYNWHAMNTGKLCPQGWHAPTYAEWTILTDYLGGLSASGAGGKLKEIGTTHWNSPNAAATNESGFTALPSGYATPSIGIGNLGVYGSTTLDPDPSVAVLALNYSYEGSPIVYKWGIGKGAGVAVRCLKDNDSPEFDNDDDGYTVDDGDCDDNDFNIHPGAAEICDGKDNDCDLAIDEDLNAPLSDLQIGVCNGRHKICGGTNGWQEPNYSLLIASYESTETKFDGLDNDCDGQTDEGCAPTDGDCDGFTVAQGDCDDANVSVHPGVSEFCGDGIDSDCDGKDPKCPENLIRNSGFEEGPGTFWNAIGVIPYLPVYAHDGSYSALFAGDGCNYCTLSQEVNIPAGALSLKINFWELNQTFVSDVLNYLAIYIDGQLLCKINPTAHNFWVHYSYAIPLSFSDGGAHTLSIEASKGPTNTPYYVDTVELIISY